MLEALIAGQSNPAAMADLAKKHRLDRREREITPSASSRPWATTSPTTGHP